MTGMHRTACAVLLAVAVAAGQDPISYIRDRVAEVTARTPNYTCLETIQRRSYANRYKDSLIVDRLRLEVAVVEGREQFSWPGGGRLDPQELQEVAGRGVTKNGDFSGFLSCIFASDSASYRLVSEQAPASRGTRYDYQVLRENSRYTVTANGISARVGFHGSFWVDPETLDLRRVEISADNLPPELQRSSADLAIDYALVAVGTGRFLLPKATEVRVVTDAGLENRTITDFSGCRQFLAESSISFEERPLEQTKKKDDVADELPAGLSLDADLTSPINRLTASTGDAVEAELRREARTRSGLILPKGAVLEGRIVMLERHGINRPYDLLMLRFAALRIGGRRMRLQASTTAGIRGGAGPIGYRTMGRSDTTGPMVFWGGFMELAKGFGLTLRTEAVPRGQSE